MPGGILVQVNRDGRPVDDNVFRRVASALDCLDQDSRFDHCAGALAYAYRPLGLNRRPSAPASGGEQAGPLVLLAGRLDHPEDLGVELGTPRASASDADLVRAAYLRYGARFVERIRGSLAAVILDQAAGRVVVARDCLGKEILYFASLPQVLLVASEPQVLARHPEVAKGLDARWLALHFSLGRVGAGGRTPFLGIEPLLPGETLVLTPHGVERFRHRPDLPEERIGFGRDADYAEHFRLLLRRSVERNVLGNGPIGVMLSGGMDSCPAACLVAEVLAGSGQAMKAYCWSLPGHPGADETREIEACADYAGIPVDFFNGDELAFFESPETWPVDLNTPVANAYLRLFLSIYRRAADDRVRVLLQGTFGDQLYPLYRHWFVEALRDRQLRLVGRELAWLLSRDGVGGLWRNQAIRHLVKRVIRYPGRAQPPPPWLTADAVALLDDEPDSLVRGSHLRAEQYDTLLGDQVFHRQIGHGVFQHRLGVIRVDPYHDWDLIAFMLAVPAYQCFREGQSKYLARLAMRGHMPERLRLRPRGGLLNAFFARGFERSRTAMREVLLDPGCSWRDYLEPDGIERALSGRACDERDQLIAWMAFSYELWRRALAREGLVP